MADIFSKKKRSEIMSNIRNKDSKMEIRLRKELWKEGYRYRKNVSGYFGKPDILLKRYKTVVFVDSCFWHGCKKHFKLPTSKVKFWKNKIEKNITRDKKVTRYYKNKGWKIVRVWEHELKKDLSKAMKKIIKSMSKRVKSR